MYSLTIDNTDDTNLLRNSSDSMISPTFSSLPMNLHTFPLQSSSHHQTSSITFPLSSQTPCSLRQNPTSVSFLSCFLSAPPLVDRTIGFHFCLICFPLWIPQLLHNYTTALAPRFVFPFTYLISSHWTATLLSHYLSLG